MRGIILAGGTGSRLHPITLGVSKQLMPVFDKPMIYYPLSTLILAGIRDILDHHHAARRRAVPAPAGRRLAVRCQLHLPQQPSPDGLAQAFVLGAEHIGNEPVALVLGDNIFYGQGMGTQLRRFENIDGGAVFGYWVADPKSYGVVEFDAAARRSPWRRSPQSPRATTPCPGCTSTTTTSLRLPGASSPRPAGELEITDVNRHYLERGKTARRNPSARHRLAGYRDVRLAERCLQLRPHDGKPPGPEDRRPRRDLLAPGLPERQTSSANVPNRW